MSSVIAAGCSSSESCKPAGLPFGETHESLGARGLRAINSHYGLVVIDEPESSEPCDRLHSPRSGTHPGAAAAQLEPLDVGGRRMVTVEHLAQLACDANLAAHHLAGTSAADRKERAGAAITCASWRGIAVRILE